jgi:hypothetical protein
MQHLGRGAEVLQLADGSESVEGIERQAGHRASSLVSIPDQNGQNKSLFIPALGS